MPPFCALEYAFQFYSSCTPENNSCTNIIFFERHDIITTQEREGYMGKPDKKKKEKTKKEGCRGRGKSTEKRNVPYTSIFSNILWSIRKQLEYSPSVFYMQMLRVPLNVGMVGDLPAFLGCRGGDGESGIFPFIGVYWWTAACNIVRNHPEKYI